MEYAISSEIVALTNAKIFLFPIPKIKKKNTHYPCKLSHLFSFNIDAFTCLKSCVEHMKSCFVYRNKTVIWLESAFTFNYFMTKSQRLKKRSIFLSESWTGRKMSIWLSNKIGSLTYKAIVLLIDSFSFLITNTMSFSP